jgi:MFS transporter, UMF1 family
MRTVSHALIIIHSSLATIMVTYLTDTLGFSSTENGIAIFSMLVGSIPGAVVAGKTVTRFNPVRSNRMATLLLAVNTIVASIVLTGREQKFVTYIVFAVWGLGVGWKWTTDRLLASILIPTGQDAELMGVYLFAGQVLTWIPPLIFTAMNEAGVDQSISIGTLSIYFVLGLIALLMISDYEKAISQTGRRSDVRTEEVSPEGRVTDDVAETIPSDPKNR